VIARGSLAGVPNPKLKPKPSLRSLNPNTHTNTNPTSKPDVNVDVRYRLVGGYGKEVVAASVENLQPEHAWNLILVDGTWVPVDATWAAGQVDSNTGEFVKKFDPFWWLCPPERFIHTHLPVMDLRMDPVAWTGVSQVPSLESFKNGLGLNGDFFASNLVLMNHDKGRLDVEKGQEINIKLQQGWKEGAGAEAGRCSSSRNQNNTATAREPQVRLSGCFHNVGADGKVREDLCEWIKVTCMYNHVSRQHHVTSKAPSRKGRNRYMLRVYASNGLGAPSRLILEFLVVTPWEEVAALKRGARLAMALNKRAGHMPFIPIGKKS